MPSLLVIDASLILCLILPGPDQARFQRQVSQWLAVGFELHAPSLYVYEVTSALCKAVHFEQLTPEHGARALSLAQRLGVRPAAPDDTMVRAAFEWTLRLGRAAAYDSFYLALAERLHCELWTADRRLCNAVKLPWVHLAGEAAV